jgi:hypothetical protein
VSALCGHEFSITRDQGSGVRDQGSGTRGQGPEIRLWFVVGGVSGASELACADAHVRTARRQSAELAWPHGLLE